MNQWHVRNVPVLRAKSIQALVCLIYYNCTVLFHAFSSVNKVLFTINERSVDTDKYTHDMKGYNLCMGRGEHLFVLS